MKKPNISPYFNQLNPSPLRGARQLAAKRKDKVTIIDASIGSVTLPTYPAIKKRLFNLSPGFKSGSLPYTPTEGTHEAQTAFINIYKALGINLKGLDITITASGSLAMQYVMLGVVSKKKPLAAFGPVYANYLSYGQRFNLPVVSLNRYLSNDGVFSIPNQSEIESFIKKTKPGALLVIPADNPTGAYFTQERLNFLAKLAVKYNLFLVSDEAYLGLYNQKDKQPSSIWRTNVPGIKGRRIGIHSASKNMNGCGLRIGAVITDNQELAQSILYCASADLCAGIVDQYLFGALAKEPKKNIQKFLKDLRTYYYSMMTQFRDTLIKEIPDLIISQPAASIYQVIDFKNLRLKNFKALDFINWSSSHAKVKINNKSYLFLTAPMSGFYQKQKGQKNPGDTQVRVAFVQPKKDMLLGAKVLAEQLKQYLSL